MFHSKTVDIEECPLRVPSNPRNLPFHKKLKGPLRILKLCVLGILLPSAFLAVPLYLRYRVYGHQLYPLAMSDMRLIDNRVSTTWCQRQLVKVNTTFNAFLLDNNPTLASQFRSLSMVRHLVLEDDTKEYWGFYLLQGSSVTVSTCVRWPGASLIVIRGHKHLHECAYIGDNSSEELDELMQAIEENAPANEPDLMKRHRQGVEFHDPTHKKTNSTIHQAIDTSDITDPKLLKKILQSLKIKVKEQKSVPRNSTIAKNESKNLEIEPPLPKGETNSQEAFLDIIRHLEKLGNKSEAVLKKVNERFQNGSFDQKVNLKGRHYSKPLVQFDDNIDRARRRRDVTISPAFDNNLSADDDENNLAIEEDFVPDGIADHRGTINETSPNDFSNSEFWSSFSSSEEALLNCSGLILNLPLTPHHKCLPDLSEIEAEETYLANTITYKVPVNGYYFFVFNSENEVQPNYIRVQFHLKKTVYNVSNPVSSCLNSSDNCAMDLRFFSSEKMVMELPVRDNSSLWNEEFVVESECEPRTVIYAVCVVSVPVFVILFAFS